VYGGPIKTVPEGNVCVAIVTCNSARYIGRCLNAVLGGAEPPLQVVVVDNASTDNTLQILKEFSGRIQVIANPRNVGFAEGQNQVLRATSTPWVLTLNPDVLVQPDFIRHLVEAGEADPQAGAVCGKLLSIGPGFEPLEDSRIDSTGIFFTPAMRHFDRGWHEPDGHHFERMEYVFGASAAAALFRRELIDDISIDGNFFDPDFFVYREDADVAWRAQLQGWRCLYTPRAVAHHVRTVTRGNRRGLPALLNMHSVKNRFLMRIKNVTPSLYRRYWLPMTLRDLLVIGGSLLWEYSSLPAFWHAARCLPRALRQRRIIMQRRRITDDELAAWFDFAPASRPLGHPGELSARKAWTSPRPVVTGETAGL
jgi:GT2 family glycosyltransferase